jgi:hypothetical protein
MLFYFVEKVFGLSEGGVYKGSMSKFMKKANNNYKRPAYCESCTFAKLQIILTPNITYVKEKYDYLKRQKQCDLITAFT